MVKASFEAGSFTVSLKGSAGQNVAIDEAHEMCINRDMKMATTRATPAYLQKTVHFLKYRIESHKNLLAQLFPEELTQSHTAPTSIFDVSSEVGKMNDNISKMIAEIQLFDTKTMAWLTCLREK